MPTSLKGHLLVAEAGLVDPNFHQSVTLLVDHDEKGALGLILNRPTGTTVKEVWAQARGPDCPIAGPVFLGGPCQSILTALHTQPGLSDLEVIPGIHFTKESEKLEKLVAANPDRARFFVGFAGWSEGQLEAELAQSAWLTVPAAIEDVLGEPERLWERLIQRLTGAGRKLRRWPPEVSPN